MIVFPVALVRGDGSFSIIEESAPFVGPGDVQHPAEAWRLWSAEDWAAMCPGWRLLPVLDDPPAEAGRRAERLPVDEWSISAEAVEVTYRLVDLTPAEIEAAKPPVPVTVTNFQARAALLAAGLFDQVNDALLALPANSTARQAWEYANELTRNGTLVNSMAETLGLTSAQLNDLFRQAVTIEA
ncbi:hypothetical protein VH569_30400 [Azospirillum sp. 11R-A]|uniref:hypothetical protein n=1 Tax=Azospirillum sp. 11R-A TaxID=3111634 RepID=UPI003C209C8C